jgi:hypothetical protein
MGITHYRDTSERATTSAVLRSGFATLASRLELGPIDARDGVAMAHRLGATLAAYHAAGAAHGGVNPGLVILPVGREWDLAVLARGGPGRGLDAWSAPERFMGLGPSFQTDVYELCATVFTALAGRPPFLAGSARELAWLVCHAPPPPLGLVRMEMASERRLEVLLAQGLSKDPRNRPSLAELMAALWRLAEGVDARDDGAPDARACAEASPRSRPVVPRAALERAIRRVAGEEARSSRRSWLWRFRATALVLALAALTGGGLWVLIH